MCIKNKAKKTKKKREFPNGNNILSLHTHTSSARSVIVCDVSMESALGKHNVSAYNKKKKNKKTSKKKFVHIIASYINVLSDYTLFRCVLCVCLPCAVLYIIPKL